MSRGIPRKGKPSSRPSLITLIPSRKLANVDHSIPLLSKNQRQSRVISSVYQFTRENFNNFFLHLLSTSKIKQSCEFIHKNFNLLLPPCNQPIVNSFLCSLRERKLYNLANLFARIFSLHPDHRQFLRPSVLRLICSLRLARDVQQRRLLHWSVSSIFSSSGLPTEARCGARDERSFLRDSPIGSLLADQHRCAGGDIKTRRIAPRREAGTLSRKEGTIARQLDVCTLSLKSLGTLIFNTQHSS